MFNNELRKGSIKENEQIRFFMQKIQEYSFEDILLEKYKNKTITVILNCTQENSISKIEKIKINLRHQIFIEKQYIFETLPEYYLQIEIQLENDIIVSQSQKSSDFSTGIFRKNCLIQFDNQVLGYIGIEFQVPKKKVQMNSLKKMTLKTISELPSDEKIKPQKLEKNNSFDLEKIDDGLNNFGRIEVSPVKQNLPSIFKTQSKKKDLQELKDLQSYERKTSYNHSNQDHEENFHLDHPHENHKIHPKNDDKQSPNGKHVVNNITQSSSTQKLNPNFDYLLNNVPKYQFSKSPRFQQKKKEIPILKEIEQYKNKKIKDFETGTIKLNQNPKLKDQILDQLSMKDCKVADMYFPIVYATEEDETAKKNNEPKKEEEDILDHRRLTDEMNIELKKTSMAEQSDHSNNQLNNLISKKMSGTNVISRRNSIQSIRDLIEEHINDDKEQVEKEASSDNESEKKLYVKKEQKESKYKPQSRRNSQGQINIHNYSKQIVDITKEKKQDNLKGDQIQIRPDIVNDLIWAEVDMNKTVYINKFRVKQTKNDKYVEPVLSDEALENMAINDINAVNSSNGESSPKLDIIRPKPKFIEVNNRFSSISPLRRYQPKIDIIKKQNSNSVQINKKIKNRYNRGQDNNDEFQRLYQEADRKLQGYQRRKVI